MFDEFARRVKELPWAMRYRLGRMIVRPKKRELPKWGEWEEIPKKERQRMADLQKFVDWKQREKEFGDLAAYAQLPKEQRYWELMWAWNNVRPAAIREMYTLYRGGNLKRMQTRRESPKAADKQDIRQFRPEEYLNGAESREDASDAIDTATYDWIANATLPERERAEKMIEPFPDDIQNVLRKIYVQRKEEDIGKVINVIHEKYFGKMAERAKNEQRDESGKPKRIIRRYYPDEILEKTIYGYDLRLARHAARARALRTLIRMLKTEKRKKEREKIKDAIAKIVWTAMLEERYHANQDIDPLQISGENWKKIRRETLLAKAGPRVLVDGSSAFENEVKRIIQDDRRHYKRKAVANAIILQKFKKIGEMFGDLKLEPEGEKPENPATTITRGEARSAEAVFSELLSDELKKLAEAKGKENITLDDLNKAARKAAERLRAHGALKSSATPLMASTAIQLAVMDFMNEYYKKYGKLPIITNEEDAEEVLEDIERYAKDSIRESPDYYYKGFVMSLLPRNGEQRTKVKKTGEH